MWVTINNICHTREKIKGRIAEPLIDPWKRMAYSLVERNMFSMYSGKG